MRGICITNEWLYLDKRVQELILQKFDGILYAGNQEGCKFYLANKEKLRRSMSLNVDYYDEPISNPNVDNKDWEDAPKGVIIGELTDRAFDKITRAITYTSYRKIWDLYFFRFQVPFTDQLSTWKHIQKTYLNKFPMVWIKFGQSTRLTDWATANGKDVWYYSEETDVNKLVSQLRN